jgi:hypothetical protein
MLAQIFQNYYRGSNTTTRPPSSNVRDVPSFPSIDPNAYWNSDPEPTYAGTTGNWYGGGAAGTPTYQQGLETTKFPGKAWS